MREWLTLTYEHSIGCLLFQIFTFQQPVSLSDYFSTRNYPLLTQKIITKSHLGLHVLVGSSWCPHLIPLTRHKMPVGHQMLRNAVTVSSNLWVISAQPSSSWCPLLYLLSASIHSSSCWSDSFGPLAINWLTIWVTSSFTWHHLMQHDIPFCNLCLQLYPCK